MAVLAYLEVLQGKAAGAPGRPGILGLSCARLHVNLGPGFHIALVLVGHLIHVDERPLEVYTAVERRP